MRMRHTSALICRIYTHICTTQIGCTARPCDICRGKNHNHFPKDYKWWCVAKWDWRGGWNGPKSATKLTPWNFERTESTPQFGYVQLVCNLTSFAVFKHFFPVRTCVRGGLQLLHICNVNAFIPSAIYAFVPAHQNGFNFGVECACVPYTRDAQRFRALTWGKKVRNNIA